MAIIPATWDMYDLIQGVLQAPMYHVIFEVTLIVLIVKIYLASSFSPEKAVLTEKEKDILVEEWEPEPLAPDVPDDHPALRAMEKYCIEGQNGKYIKVNGKSCLNMAIFNFLGMNGKKEIEEDAVKALRVYGVGSCGPRGFYGTMDVHLELEDKLSKFMNCEEAILYSYGFACIASAIPAYSKRGDLIFADESVCFAIQKGLVASRSHVRWFRHNDMDHLESLLIEQSKADKKNPKKAKVTRRFILVEGLYLNSGDICPLPKLVELKWKYKVRIFLEETMSFGVLGATGRGVTEHFDISPDQIDMISCSLENAIGSVGGFCCGKKFIIDHQRLSGLGYCFSASQPPMLASSAIQSLKMLQEKPSMLVDLREASEKLHAKLENISGVNIVGIPISPIKHIQLTEPAEDRDLDLQTLQMVVDEAMSSGVALTVARYLEPEEHSLMPPSIRLTVNCELTDTEIDTVIRVLSESFELVFQKLSSQLDMTSAMDSVEHQPALAASR
ncbi:serine palmitoyltransferase 1 [Aplysia californica]|uniref:Serine palmitoyltransferase 1 n=1 Tax=Aplysia californica TaxID=6500 RepID=A0ABM0JR50_APLCA|nr:serine palmitoyltransferase 1 [Aplysia californica]